VATQAEPVSRDQAAQALAISRALAAFHLDKLVEEGLLSAEYQRLTGRSGPGAGRPSKLYRRSGRQMDISLPPRSYELAARLLVEALAHSRSHDAVAALRSIAHDFGQDLSEEAQTPRTAEHDATGELGEAQEILARCGYEPYRDSDGGIRLRNCPFHSLASAHRELVCGMNLSLLEGVAAGLDMHHVRPVLDPVPGECCVRFTMNAPPG
jgi:predicted ArsR family transcriptional regulator